MSNELERRLREIRLNWEWGSMESFREAARIGAQLEREACIETVKLHLTTGPAPMGYKAETERRNWLIGDIVSSLEDRSGE